MRTERLPIRPDGSIDRERFRELSSQRNEQTLYLFE